MRCYHCVIEIRHYIIEIHHHVIENHRDTTETHYYISKILTNTSFQNHQLTGAPFYPERPSSTSWIPSEAPLVIVIL